MNNSTIVLPTSRSIREHRLKIDNQTLFLPSFITMGEFISKLTIVKGFKPVDDDTRVILLLKAAEFKSFENLQIDRNFFTFTKNSSYIFKFFEELSAEKFEIDKLASSDVYAEFEEHIEILTQLYKRYEKLCLEEKILDKIFLPKIYKFNENYAKSLKNVEIKIDGHLTNFEFELLEGAKEFCNIDIIFTTTNFNTKMQKKFDELGIELEVGYEYKISLNNKNIISKNKIDSNKNISCNSFSETALQVAFVKKKVYELIHKGYAADKIAVVVPDEKFATMLKSFDNMRNFNFAMGHALNETLFYKKIEATVDYIDQDSKENLARIKRVGEELYSDLRDIFYKKAVEVELLQYLHSLKEYIEDDEVLKIYEDELYNFDRVITVMSDMTVKSVLSVFMQRLAARSIDDVLGGKITVMGVLESRSIELDGVIIVDFDDSNVPKKSEKDMFLNTQIREMANLPTSLDRQNLQKHYYEMLINNSKEVAISYVASAESSASRFLKQLRIKEDESYDEKQLSNILFDKAKTKYVKDEKDIVAKYDFRSSPLSASKLKTYLTCKRKFYYKYIEHLTRHDIPTDMIEQYELGNIVHTALYDIYTKKSSYSSADELQKDLEKALDEKIDKNSEIERYFIALQKSKMKEFSLLEIDRFNEGWEVQDCEVSMSCEFAGLQLIGQIDRLDARKNELSVIDYKTGNYPTYNKNNFTEATDFQLEFYYLLVKDKAEIINCAYYDLNENKLVKEPFLEEKLAVLESNIKDMLAREEINFEKCEDEKNCLFCDYKIICGRD
ncbi:PD-(D/E)XK nuclease family protein [Sulfurimonas sp.]|uniref:PD-(D/E)XK nuclease family protein n=1 Tax=Sulfurimonas sp. TaxID=2022749 RepID=UPI00356A34C5